MTGPMPMSRRRRRGRTWGTVACRRVIAHGGGIDSGRGGGVVRFCSRSRSCGEFRSISGRTHEGDEIDSRAEIGTDTRDG